MPYLTAPDATVDFGTMAGMSILITGFEPFDGETVNPSGEIALALHGRDLGGHRVHGVVLPVDGGWLAR